MSSKGQKQTGTSTNRPGFDAAVTAREQDYLNRWPFAHEIYGIATTGPREWSVRIGIYGEWGTGKTSVLSVVRLMAETDQHIVVPFNPWQFTSTDELWENFVKIIFDQLEERLGEYQPGRASRGIKGVLGRVATDAPRIIGAWRKEAATALETGLSYVKRFLTFGPNDLKELQQRLGNRRIIVLIDDLDRTDPKLVPEMLFALKELMDVPGMAFVCAFDPIVVGKVLGLFHPGFGDGLDFLEKIIDYPRWLPEATVDQLARLAVADATEYCPYVPRENLEEIVPLLPPNPRAIRQFVRLLRLLRPQIERHRPDEIRWSILLAANVVKVRFPRIAPEILGNDKFWHSIYQTSVMGSEGRDDERKKIVDDEVEKLATQRGLDDSAKADLNRGIWAIAKRLQIWFGIPHEALMYQFHLAERPCAVTWKEFDQFLSGFQGAQMSAEAVTEWMRAHAVQTSQSEDQVFKELLEAATHERLSELARAADATEESAMRLDLERADLLLRLLSILILGLGRIEAEPRVGANQIKALFESFARYFSWRITDLYRQARAAEESLLLEIPSKWGPEILPLIDALGLQDWEGRHDLDGTEWRAVVQRVRQILNPKFASWIIRRFRDDSDFVSTRLHEPEQGYRIRALLLDKEGAIWKDRRDEILAVLDAAPSNETVRGNTYQFLEWVESLFRRNEPEAGKASNLLSDAELALSLWKAATSQRLNPRAVGSLQSLLVRLKEIGLQWQEPEWWVNTVADLQKLRPKSETSSQ